MTNAAVDVALRLRLKDEATPGIDRAAQQAQASARGVAQAAVQAQGQQLQAIERTAQQAQAADARQRASGERLSQAREMLGVRSERAIQREIRQTEAAFNRLARTGFASEQERQRALEATTRRVQQLTNEMGRLTAAQEKQAAAERGGRVLQGAGVVAAGAAGAYAAVRGSVTHAMNTDLRLAHLANTAYRERDATGKRAGMEEMRTAVDGAVNRFGGTRDGATGVLEELMASGAVSDSQALKMLPALVKAGTAANADPAQLAQIGIRAMQTFKLRAEDMPNVLNMALAAGQAGGFELKDMAKWLPQQMAAATMSGLSGREGFAKLAALNQAAAITAGSKDEAGNNVVNLLGKINSADTANDAKKLGINLPKYLQERRAKGVDSVDAFAELVEQVIGRRGDYKGLQQKLAGAKTPEDKKATLEAMAVIAEGAGIGKLVQDRQALMALLGMRNNREYMAKVLAEVRGSDRAEGGAVDRNFELISDTGAFRNQRREQAMEAAKDRALGDGGSTLGRINDFVADAAAKFPVLAGSTAVAAAGVTAMAGAAGLATLALGRLGGGGTGAGAAGAIGRASGRAAPYASRAGRLVRGGAVAGIGAAAGGMLLEKVAGEDSAVTRYGSAALNGAALGATVGSLVPVVGTALGAGVGALGGALVEWLKGAPKQEPPKMQADVKVSVSDDRVQVSQQLRATGVDARLSSGAGSIWQGAPQ